MGQDKGTASQPAPELVAEGVYRLQLPMRFHPGHINSYLLRDVKGWTVVDCGNHSEETREVWRQLIDNWLAGEPITRIVLTHAHPDHFGSAPWLLEQTGARLSLAREEWHAMQHLWRGSSERPEELAGFFQARGVAEQHLPSIQLFMEGFRHGCPPCDHDPCFVAPGERLRIGEQDWILHGGYGHTPCNLLLWRESDGTIITGDQVLPAITPNVSLWYDSESDPMGRKLETLSRLQTLTVSLALPAHGDPFDNFSARCEALARTYQRRIDRVRQRLRKGAANLEQLGEAGFGKSLNGPMYMLVAGQLLALLAHLQARHEVKFDGELYQMQSMETQSLLS